MKEKVKSNSSPLFNNIPDDELKSKDKLVKMLAWSKIKCYSIKTLLYSMFILLWTVRIICIPITYISLLLITISKNLLASIKTKLKENEKLIRELHERRIY